MSCMVGKGLGSSTKLKLISGFENQVLLLKKLALATMAAVSASSSTLVARAALVPNPKLGSSPTFVLGLPKMARVVKIRCSMEDKPSTQTQEKEANPSMAMVASLATTVAATMSSPTALALVDERMSTEGTGLPFGLSNNLLGWILLGVFGLIWSFYTVYTSGLDEDEDSGMSL